MKLKPQEIKLLGESGEQALLAKYLELRQSQRDKDFDHESKVCKFWRTAGLPQSALAATSYLESRGNRPARDKYAWTCRAAAFADMYEDDRKGDSLDQAARCGESALKCDKDNAHTYNCMGRIRFLQGDTDEADHCFRRAEELAGEENAAQTREGQLGVLAASLRRVDPRVAAEAILRLMRLDPVRYRPLLEILPAALREEVLRRLSSPPTSDPSAE